MSFAGAKVCPFSGIAAQSMAATAMDILSAAQNETPPVLKPSDELVIPRQKSIIVQYTNEADAPRELRLYYGAKEISFDEPELFAFGETLAKQRRFLAGAATEWGHGYEWARVRELFEQLIAEGILHYAGGIDEEDVVDGDDRASPLPPAPATRARSWSECEAIMAELTGRPLELGHLELVVPIFRVAHMALDADGRQVGEANVFPKAMRLDTPTQWRSCSYSGSRYQVGRPMNVSALKAMRTYWGPMMAMLQHVRAAYLDRFPSAREGWTVGHLERLATSVLALPTYLLMRGDKPIPNGELHPALSCLFRVTDGLRMVMHQMLFVPIGEPTLSPEMPITAAEIYAYAERNYSFHSEHGVCAGPQWMVQEFLSVLIDGTAPKHGLPEQLDAGIEEALEDLEPALDYALLGLEAYACVFSLWPAMTRSYETLFEIAQEWAAGGNPKVAALRDRLAAHMETVKRATYLGSENWRVERQAVYEDMYGQCAHGLTGAFPSKPLRARLAPVAVSSPALESLRNSLARYFGSHDAVHLDTMAACIMDFFAREQAVLRLASEVQAQINALLGRAAPVRPFDARDIDLHNTLQGNQQRRLPYLVDELEDIFGLKVALDSERLEITNASERPQA